MSTEIVNFSSECADRLLAERLRLRFSQDQAGDACGVSREMWGRYERAKATPGGDVLLRFQLAGADVQYILTGQPSTPALCAEQARAGYVVEVLSPAEAAALAGLRASGALQGGSASPRIKQTNSGNASIMVGINNGGVTSEQGSDAGRKRRR